MHAGVDIHNTALMLPVAGCWTDCWVWWGLPGQACGTLDVQVQNMLVRSIPPGPPVHGHRIHCHELARHISDAQHAAANGQMEPVRADRGQAEGIGQRSSCWNRTSGVVFMKSLWWRLCCYAGSGTGRLGQKTLHAGM